MTLPEIRYSDGIGKSNQVKFYGLDHRVGAPDGAIWDMKNMGSQDFPVLSTRRKRVLYRTLQKPNGLFGWGGMTRYVTYACPYCGQRTGEGTKAFILPDEVRVALQFIF